jgi:hypothetical protein
MAIRKLFAILCCLLIPLIANATSYQDLGLGDSIMLGVYGATNGPMPTLNSYSGRTWINLGISGKCIKEGVSDISGYLSSYSPQRVYNNYGINDIRTGTGGGCYDLSGWLTAYGSINTS